MIPSLSYAGLALLRAPVQGSSRKSALPIRSGHRDGCDDRGRSDRGAVRCGGGHLFTRFVVDRDVGVIVLGADLVGPFRTGRERRGVESPAGRRIDLKLLGLLMVPDSAMPFVPAMFEVAGVPSELRSLSVTTVPSSVPPGATRYAADANAPLTVVTLDHLIVNVAPAATETG